MKSKRKIFFRLGMRMKKMMILIIILIIFIPVLISEQEIIIFLNVIDLKLN